MLTYGLFMTTKYITHTNITGGFCRVKDGRKNKVFLRWGLPLSSTNWHVSKGVGFIQPEVSLAEKRKEFFVVLFCDLEGLLQQFVAAAWKIMHWKSTLLNTSNPLL